MSVPVSLEQLLDAYQMVSAGDGAGVDVAAFVSKASGSIYWRGEGIDDEVPEDIDDERLYLAVPGKYDLDLGRALALRFVEEFLPRSLHAVRGFFKHRGAYTRFKSLLDDAGQLDAWFEYERMETERALREWCEENGFELS
jgi:hypothetical protein